MKRGGGGPAPLTRDHMLVGRDFKAGDPAPGGYLDWHEWAAVQHKAGLRQRQCPECGKWRFPQETCCPTTPGGST